MMAPDPQMWWQHRRRHSYVALGAAVTETFSLLGAYFAGNDLAGAEAIIYPSLVLWGSIIGAYIGTSVVDDLRARQLGQHPQAR